MKGKYDQAIDPESAYEVLQKRTHDAAPRPPAGRAARRGAPQEGGGILGQIGGVLGSIFGTSRPRGERLSTGQLITREITRSVTNKVAGQIAGRHRQVDRRLDGQHGRPRDRARDAGRDIAPIGLSAASFQGAMRSTSARDP